MNWQFVSGVLFGAFVMISFGMIPGGQNIGYVLGLIIAVGAWFNGLQPLAKGFAIGFIGSLMLLYGGGVL